MYGKKLRRLRKSRKMTMREMGAELNIPFTTLGNYEREDREPNIKTLILLADYFKVKVDDLIR